MGKLGATISVACAIQLTIHLASRHSPRVRLKNGFEKQWERTLNILVIDVGGTHVKILATEQTERRRIASGPAMTPEQMVSQVKEMAADWTYDAVSIGYPGVVSKGQISTEPHNLAPGWIGFDFEAAFEHPVKLINDAAMQALGSYAGGLLLFVGLGTGLGSALVADGVVVPMELGHLSYKKGTFEDYIGLRGLERLGKKKWRRHVSFAINRLMEALRPDDVVLGGGNSKNLKDLPPGCRLGDNSFAFEGGFRLWKPDHMPVRPQTPVGNDAKRTVQA